MGEPAAVPSELELVCGAFGPNASASRVPVHGAGFTGGMKRFVPPVDAPYGMPLNTLTPSMTTPRTFNATGSITSTRSSRGSASSSANRQDQDSSDTSDTLFGCYCCQPPPSAL